MYNRFTDSMDFRTIRRPSCRAVLRAQLVLLLLAAVALTIMPQETLAATSAAFAWAHSVAMDYRPVVAFVGLLLVGGLVWSLIAMARPGLRAEASAEERENQEHESLRPAA